MLDNTQIAEICHAAYVTHCEVSGLPKAPAWAELSKERQDEQALFVGLIRDNHGASVVAVHEKWLEKRLSDGWTHGEKVSAKAKTHPAIAEFSSLPLHYQEQERMFHALVRALAPA